MTTFRTVVLLARRIASPARFFPLVFASAGSRLSRLVRPATAGPAPTSRCPGFSRIPPFNGATFTGAGRITILSPACDACCTFARVRNGEWRDPFPPGRAVALTYQTCRRCLAAAALEAAPSVSPAARIATTTTDGHARGVFAPAMGGGSYGLLESASTSTFGSY